MRRTPSRPKRALNGNRYMVIIIAPPPSPHPVHRFGRVRLFVYVPHDVSGNLRGTAACMQVPAAFPRMTVG